MRQKWRERSLGEITYLYEDDRYERVRQAGHVQDSTFLIATGITPSHLIRTTNSQVRVSREVHCRTRVVGFFPNEAVCLHPMIDVNLGLIYNQYG